MTKTKPLVLKKFSKYYGEDRGAIDIDLEVEHGEIFGFLGANGAGKTTTIRSILNFIQPTSGSISVYGLDSVEDSVEIKERVGYLAGDISLFEKRKAKDVISHLAKLNNVGDHNYINKLAGRLKAEMNRPIKDLSKGNKQKIGLIIAMMQNPDLLVLDEPTSGLDPLMKTIFYELVNEMKQQGKTIFVSSHDLSEVERICDRAAFIKQGKLVSIEKIKDNDSLRVRKYRIILEKKPKIKQLKQIESVLEVEQEQDDGENYFVKLTTKGSLAKLMAEVTPLGVIDIDEIETSLEDLFLHYYK